jgi:hypothetical protein
VTLEELVGLVPNFTSLGHTEKLRILLWWFHTQKAAQFVKARGLSAAYNELGMAEPGNIHGQLESLVAQRHVLKDRSGFRLERSRLDELTVKYGQRDATIRIEKQLSELPDKLANPEERSYLEETIRCLRAKAYRAAVVMAWNLSYDHLCYWVMTDSRRLAKFNTELTTRYAKKGYTSVAKRDDFEEPKEFEVIQVLAWSGILTGPMETVLKQKLDRRNKAAHPSSIVVNQLNAEDFISDLIENVVLKLQ